MIVIRKLLTDSRILHIVISIQTKTGQIGLFFHDNIEMSLLCHGKTYDKVR